MSNSNITKNNWNDNYVNLASGLGLSIVKGEYQAEWTEYFVLGYLIAKTFSDDYAEKGYVEKDSCSWLWEDSGLADLDINFAIYWLNLNGYVDQIWLEGPRLAYKVAQWVIGTVMARMVDDDLDLVALTCDE